MATLVPILDRKDAYVCNQCHRGVVTIVKNRGRPFRVEGEGELKPEPGQELVPGAIACLAGCGGSMLSVGSGVPQQLRATHRWARPSSGLVRRLRRSKNTGTLAWVAAGGLILKPWNRKLPANREGITSAMEKFWKQLRDVLAPDEAAERKSGSSF